MYLYVKIVTSVGSDAPQSSRADAFAFVESEILAALGGVPLLPIWILQIAI